MNLLKNLKEIILSDDIIQKNYNIDEELKQRMKLFN